MGLTRKEVTTPSFSTATARCAASSETCTKAESVRRCWLAGPAESKPARYPITFLRIGTCCPLSANLRVWNFPSGWMACRWSRLCWAKPAQPQHDFLYWEFYERGGKRAVRFGDWKAVQLNVNQDRNSAVEIFDLQKDPGETEDLASARPELVAQAREWMAQAHSPSEFWAFKAKPPRKKKSPRELIAVSRSGPQRVGAQLTRCSRQPARADRVHGRRIITYS